MQNGCFDSEKGSQEYQDYYTQLNNLENLIGVVYKEAISAVYGGDFISFNSQAKAYINDIKFCGKEFLMKLATQFCEQYQKEALADLD